MVSTPSATDTQVGGGGRPRLVSTAIKTFSSRGRLLGKKAPMTEGKATKGSSAPHVTSARGTIAATRQPGIPASTFSTGCAGGTVASFIPQPSESDSDIVSLQPPPRLPPSAWMGASGSDFGLLPSRWCLSDDDEDDDVAEGARKSVGVQLRFFIARLHMFRWAEYCLTYIGQLIKRFALR